MELSGKICFGFHERLEANCVEPGSLEVVCQVKVVDGTFDLPFDRKADKLQFHKPLDLDEIIQRFDGSIIVLEYFVIPVSQIVNCLLIIDYLIKHGL